MLATIDDRKSHSRSSEQVGTPRLKIGKPKLTFHQGREGNYAWVEYRLDESWVAAYRLVPQDGRPVIAEARIVPYVEKLPPGASPGTFIGEAPRGGVQSAQLAALRTEAVLRAQLDVIEWWDSCGQREFLERIQRRFGFDPVAVRSTAARRPHAAGDEELARIASEYVRECQAGTPAPRKSAAASLCISEGQLAKRLHAARERGILSGARPGRAGGELTSYGKRLLAGLSS
jgi:hypothetical protein